MHLTGQLQTSRPPISANVLRCFVACLMFVTWGVWLIWLFQFPLQISSDDALFFSRGVERFSVVELSPHFPGYPVFIALARVTNAFTDSETAVVLTSLMSAALIPWLLILLYQNINQCHLSTFPLLTLILLCILQPLLAATALSGLSDTAGLLFAISSLLMVYHQRYLFSGILLGIMLATRPSYFPLAIGMAVCIPLIPMQANHLPRHFLKIYGKGLLGVLLIALPSLLYVLARDGLAYFDEALRFTRGHFQIWGNTAESDVSWQQWLFNLAEIYSWPLLLTLTLSLFSALKNATLRPLALVICIYLGWVLCAQNPDNPRHILPVVMLWIPILITQISDRLWACLLIVFISLVLFLSSVRFTTVQSPTEQAIEWFQMNACDNNSGQIGSSASSNASSKTGSNIASNYAVSLLRQTLPDCQIYDMYYPSSEALLQAGGGYRLSGKEQTGMQLIATFPARFTGEKTLYLYRFIESGW